MAHKAVYLCRVRGTKMTKSNRQWSIFNRKHTDVKKPNCRRCLPFLVVRTNELCQKAPRVRNLAFILRQFTTLSRAILDALAPVQDYPFVAEISVKSDVALYFLLLRDDIENVGWRTLGKRARNEWTMQTAAESGAVGCDSTHLLLIEPMQSTKYTQKRTAP